MSRATNLWNPIVAGLAMVIAASPSAVKAASDGSDEFFATGAIPQLRIRLTPKEEQQLRADQRRYVDCTLIEDEKTSFHKVKVKLKGNAGSFRNLDDRPAFTLSMRKKNERFHGMDKFHLNNSVQDESYLNELLASQVCREAGYPAPRVSHARVWLNDRDLGFYVLKEGVDEIFLARHFANPKGNLYDGGFLQDIDAPKSKDGGDGPDDMSDMKALVAACREGDQAKRWAQLAERVDIPAFLNFVALELMMCHWDGYSQNRNNYRIYFHADDRRACLLPQGMDQMFRDPNFQVFQIPPAMLSNNVLQNPQWNSQYRRRVRELLPLFAAEKLHAKIDAGHARIRPALAAINPDRAKQLDDRVRDLKNMVNDRQKNIREQFPPELVESWTPLPAGDAKLEQKLVDGRPCLLIETGPSNRCVASFRAKLLLGKGNYRFEARVKPTNVAAIADEKGAGAGVRLAGANRQNQVAGSSDWQNVTHAFSVVEDLREVDLVAELRSTAGSVLFDCTSLRVVVAK